MWQYGRKRRRKRFIFHYILANGLCHAITSSGVDNANERLQMASDTLHQAEQRLQDSHRNFHTQGNYLYEASLRLAQVNDQLARLQSQLKERRTTRSLLISFATQIRPVEIHFSNVLDSSVVLRDEIMKLIDFKLVIQPLNDIYEIMLKNKIMEPFGFEITAETARQINANLEKLAEKLPTMSSGGLLETDSDKVLHDKNDDEQLTTSSIEYSEVLFLVMLVEKQSIRHQHILKKSTEGPFPVPCHFFDG